MKILAFGEILWDIYPDNKYIGGAPLNYAAHFVKCGGKASICSAVGEDELGCETVAAICELGVDTEYIFRNKRKTGQCIVTLDENSVPSYELLEDTAYDAIVPPNEISDFDALYFGTLALRSEANRECIEEIIQIGNFCEVFVDVNIRKPFISKNVLNMALENATILKISDEELAEVLKLAEIEVCEPRRVVTELCKRFKNLKIVLITFGAEGSCVYEKKTDSFCRCAGNKVDAVSTVGAGDSFSAAFTAQYLQKKSIEECVRFANRISAFVVSKKEAVPMYELMN